MANKTLKTTMNTMQTELKAVAKTIGSSLRRQGHVVPHSHVLHAVAAALNKRNWHALKACTDSGDARIAAPVAASPVNAPQFSDRTLFMLRLALLAGSPVDIHGVNDEQARALALMALARTYPGLRFGGTVKAGAWNVPADLLLEHSRLDAGDFALSESATGQFRFTVGKSALGLEVVYLKDNGWFPSAAGVGQLWKELAALVPEATVLGSPGTAAKAASLDPVTTEFWTDDHEHECSFDASWYLAQCTDDVLRGIMNVGYANDYLLDNIAEAAAGFPGCEVQGALNDAFEYLSAVNRSRKRESLGFGVRVDPQEFLRWMRKYRPVALAKELCERHGISVVAADEPELHGKWDWTGESQACSASLDSEDEAFLDAMRVLQLYEQELRAH